MTLTSRLDHIGGIQAAAHANLQHGHFHAFAREIARRRSRSSSRKNWDATEAFPFGPDARHSSRCRHGVWAKSSSPICSPSMRMRSLMRIRCGEVYRPVFSPRRAGSKPSVAAVDPLPFVPAISTLGNVFRDGPVPAAAPAYAPDRIYCEGVFASSCPRANMLATAVL